MFGCIHEAFERQVLSHSNRIAVQYQETTLTYHELNEQSNAVAALLQEQGVEPGDLVAVSMERSLELVSTLLGILKAGAAYVPIEPTYPVARQHCLFEDSKAKLVLSQPTYIDLWTPKRVIAIDANILREKQYSQLEHDVNQLCYVIYTSGSTGKPKGVALEHKAVMNRLQWMQKYFPIGPGDIVLQKTPFSFDVSVWEFFWPLMTGAKLLLAKPEGHKDPIYILNLIQQEKVTIMHFVPTMLSVFLSVPEVEHCQSLRHVFSSGESLSSADVNIFNQKLSAKLHNLYGPTEAAIDVSFWTSPQDKLVSKVPIGKAIDNIELYILDDYLNPVRNGEAGELHIAGIGLAREYWQQPELTSSKFIYHAPIPGGETKRLYKTGDLARWLPDENVEYLGRLDEQVKIRGNRIELGEIEHCIRSLSIVEQAIVAVRSDVVNEEQQQLVAYFIAKSSHKNSSYDTSEAIRKYLMSQLPDYMIPHYIIGIESLPLTTSGKVDKKRLPHPLKAQEVAPTFLDNNKSADQREVAKTLIEIWQLLLKVRVSTDDNFFALGGDSILALKMINMAAQQRIAITVAHVTQYQTINQLLPFCEKTPLRPINTSKLLEKGMSYNLSMIQKGFLFHKLYAPESNAYVIQSVFTLDKSTNIQLLRLAWKFAYEQEPMLQTAFKWEHTESTQQYSKIKTFPWSEFQINDDNSLQAFLDDDRDNLFSFENGPLFRLSLLSAKEHSCLVFTWHHIILDGWSLELLIKKVGEYYHLLLSGHEIKSVTQNNYYHFVEHQRASSFLEHKIFWQKSLENIEKSCTHFSFIDNETTSEQSDYLSESYVLDKNFSTRLYDFSKHNAVSVNTLFEAAWGILVSHYMNNDDVIFGLTFSGRTVDVPNIQEMIGCFVSTVPMRIQLRNYETIKTLLYRISDQTRAINKYSDAALSYINCWSNRPDKTRCLFNHILVFDSYESQLINASPMGLVNQIEKSEYPMMVKISTNSAIKVQVYFETQKYSVSNVKLLLKDFKAVLELLVNNPMSLVDDVKKSIYSSPVKRFVFRQKSTLNSERSTAKNQKLLQFENIIVNFWKNLLKVDNVKLDDNFFELGGQSILALKLMLKIRKEFLINFSVGDVINFPTIRQMSEKVKQLSEASEVE